MICPVCGYENIQGQDECENCGSDLRTADIPQPGSSFDGRLVEQPLATLRPPEPIRVTSETSVAEAVRRMQAVGTGCLLVEDAGQLRGIVTERDLVLKAGTDNLQQLTVGELMTPDPVVLREDDSIAVAIHKMAVGGFRHIPLVENGHAASVVSARDIFRYILEVID
jgi:CBS domain-containing protein